MSAVCQAVNVVVMLCKINWLHHRISERGIEGTAKGIKGCPLPVPRRLLTFYSDL